mmetsp:Transcript_22662/g.52438  ORF Transcript_22662/g.52438 Transcript_22662/m.52438 type:complete len:211 (-) Transcript_22662:485-1117(-)
MFCHNLSTLSPCPRSENAEALRFLTTEREELSHHLRKVLLEEGIVLSIHLHVFAEALVLDEHHVGRQHHEVACWIFELQWTLPRLSLVSGLDGPDVLQQLTIVLIAHCGWRTRPWTPKPAAVCVACAQAMSAAQCHNLLVVEAHPVEDQPQVGRCLVGAPHVGAWQTAVLARRTIPKGAFAAARLVLAPWNKGHLLTAHLFNGNTGREDP